jgi:hypothetical protein
MNFLRDISKCFIAKVLDESVFIINVNVIHNILHVLHLVDDSVTLILDQCAIFCRIEFIFLEHMSETKPFQMVAVCFFPTFYYLRIHTLTQSKYKTTEDYSVNYRHLRLNLYSRLLYNYLRNQTVYFAYIFRLKLLFTRNVEIK